MDTRYYLLALVAGMAAASTASPAPARAVILTQDTTPVPFNISGSQTAINPNTTPLNFNPFTASTSSTLTGVQVKFVPDPVFGGTVQLANGSAPLASFVGTASPSFTFSSPGLSTTGSASLLTLNPSSFTGPAFVPATVSGPYLGTTSPLAAATLPLQAYFTSAPTINSYYANWSIVGIPTGGATDLNSATFSGQIYLSYQYTSPDPVPGPLPILGAGAAFGFSRKLRQRIRSSAG
jgi:hypothetical protein